MTKVKNSKVIRRLAYREFKANRKLNIVVILSIMLTCILFTALTTIGGSLVNGAQQETMRQVGGQSMLGIKKGYPEDWEVINGADGVYNANYTVLVGTCVNEGIKNISIEVRYAGSDYAAKDMFSYPEQGSMPTAEDEFAASDIALKEMGVEPGLGEKVNVRIETDGEISEHELTVCGIWHGDAINAAQQMWISPALGKKSFPLLHKGDDVKDLMCGFTSISFDLSNSFNIEGRGIALINDLFDGEDAERIVGDLGINWAYTGSHIDSGLLTAGVILILLITSAGYLIIYNIFNINISANIRSYGLLKTIGTTARQIRKMVRIQACIYSVIGIPSGLLIGVLLGKLLISSILTITVVVSTASYEVDAALLAYICVISAVFTFITVLFSCHKPCIMAGSVSPIEALRYNETDIDIKKKDKKTKRITPFTVARNNMSRSRKKTVVVVLSLTLSMVLFNTLYTALSGIDADKYISHSIVGDVVIRHTDMTDVWSEKTKGVTPEDIAAFEQIEGAEVHPVYHEDAKVRSGEAQLAKISELYERYKDVEELELELSVALERPYNASVYGIDEAVLDKLEPDEGTIDKEKFLSGKYAIVHTYIWETDNDPDTELYKTGDTITISTKEGVDHEYEVMAITEMPYPLSTKAYGIIETEVILPTEECNKLSEEPGAVSLMINASDDSGMVEEQCRELCDREGSPLVYSDKQSILEEYAGFLNMVKLVGGTLSGVLALIGILNFVNTVITSMISRKREFAMMNAVGMTGGQLKTMLRWEGMHYSILTAALSVVIGSALSYFALGSLAKELFFFSYSFTMLPMLICVPVLMVISAVIPTAAYSIACRDSIVERLREN